MTKSNYNMTLYIEPEYQEKLREIADQNQRSISKQIKRWVDQQQL